MKKLAFYLIAVCTTFSLNAQLTISPIAGGSLSTVNFHLPENYDTKPVLRYFVGAQASYHFSEKFATGIGLQYATKGYKSDTNNPIWNSEARFKYLELMPFVEYRLFRPIGLMAGGSIGLLLDEKYKVGDSGWSSPYVELVNPLDISGLIGIKFYLSEMYFSLIYNNSVASTSDINFTDENGNPIGNGKQFNQNLLLGIGYNFHLKKK